MKTYKIEELEGALLDAAAAKARGWLVIVDEPGWAPGDLASMMAEYNDFVVRWYAIDDEGDDTDEIGGWEPLRNLGSPSTDWTHGGPLIERERIKLMPTIPTGQTWYATKTCGATLAEMQVWRGKAATPLIAAMRCYVASKFGETVELPD